MVGTPRGFAFVAAEDGGPDVFIPAEGVGPALHGDRVEIVVRRSPKGREGRVVEVLDRRSRIVTGVVRIQGPRAPRPSSMSSASLAISASSSRTSIRAPWTSIAHSSSATAAQPAADRSGAPWRPGSSMVEKIIQARGDLASVADSG
jgi:cold shock CspA family protein